MIRITQLKLPVDHTEEDLRQQIARKLRCHAGSCSWKIVRQSLDARHKDDKKYVYTVDVSVENEKKILRKVHDNNIMLITKKEYHFPSAGGKAPKHPPVIVGSGPAGLFCASPRTSLWLLGTLRPCGIRSARRAPTPTEFELVTKLISVRYLLSSPKP